MTKRQMRFRVLKPGVIKRGFEKESPQIGSLEVGSVIEALERRGNRVQAQITDTQTGWVSVISQKGAVIIEEKELRLHPFASVYRIRCLALCSAQEAIFVVRRAKRSHRRRRCQATWGQSHLCGGR